MRILRRLGHRAHHVQTIVEGQARCASLPEIHVALVDVGLGNGESGLAFVSWLRREHTEVRRIVISGLAPPSGLGVPPDERFVRKPFGEPELAAALRPELRS